MGKEMTHLSEVAKLVQHGLKGDATAVRAYAELLLSKVREEGDERAVAMLEVALGLRDPGVMIYPQGRVACP